MSQNGDIYGQCEAMYQIRNDIVIFWVQIKKMVFYIFSNISLKWPPCPSEIAHNLCLLRKNITILAISH